MFVLAVSVHASIGLRSIMREWLQMRGLALSGLSWLCFAGLLGAGARAIAALVGTL